MRLGFGLQVGSSGSTYAILVVRPHFVCFYIGSKAVNLENNTSKQLAFSL